MTGGGPLISALIFAIVDVAPHRLFLTTINGLICLLVGGFALFVQSRSLRRERWVVYFSIAFLIFAAQYLVPSGFGIYRLLAGLPIDTHAPTTLQRIIQVVASTANTAVFLAVARVLMRKNRTFPWWVWLIGAFTIATDSLVWWKPWNRLPDAVFSAIVLFIVGYSLFINIRPRLRRLMASLAILGGAGYGLLSIAYALNPALVGAGRLPSFSAAVLKRLKQSPEVMASIPGETEAEQVVHAIDTFLFTLAVPFKLGLAATGFILMVRALIVISPRYLSKALEIVSSNNLEFFTGRTILQPIGESLDAERVALLFRLPGLRERQVACWEWGHGSTASRRDESLVVKELPPADDGREGTVLARGTPVEEPKLRDPEKSLIIVPIRHHDHTTGCLSIEWAESFAFTPMVVEQTSRFANLISPLVEERRQLAALDRWGRQLQEIDLGSASSGYSSRAVAERLAKLIYEILAPVAVGVSFDVGFRAFWGAVGENGSASGYLGDVPLVELGVHLRAVAGPLWQVPETPLEAKKVPIGTLLIAWPEFGTSSERPVIFSDELHRKTIGSLASASLLEAAQIGLWGRLNRLQTDFSSPEAANKSGWLDALGATVRESGPLWVVVQEPNGDFLGSSSASEIVARFVGSDSALDDEAIRLISLSEPEGDLRNLVRLFLPASRYVLWLGIRRSGFGPELKESWPWRIFLERLIEASDASLSRILAREEVQRLQRETDQFKALMTAGTDSTTFIHEIRNLARNFQAAAHSLDDARQLGLLNGPESIEKNITDLSDSAQRLYALANSVLNSKPSDTRTVYPLLDLINVLRPLLQPLFDQHQIELEVSIDPKLIILFPFHFAHQALLSLISNSIDAIDRAGKIYVKSEDDGKFVLCHITDTGPGVPPKLVETVFELGVSSKTGTGGKRLFLVRRLLRENGGDAQLTHPGPRCKPGCTTFTVRFPKPRLRKKL
jgi:signal transduction histidine kinase